MKARPPLILCAALTADGKRNAAPALRRNFTTQPGDVLFAPTARGDLAARLRGLRAQPAVRRILCFGGPALFRRLFDAEMVDELWLLLRPTIDGRRDAPTLSGVPDTFFPASIRCRLLKVEVQGNECFLHYRVRRTKANHPAAG